MGHQVTKIPYYSHSRLCSFHSTHSDSPSLPFWGGFGNRVGRDLSQAAQAHGPSPSPDPLTVSHSTGAQRLTVWVPQTQCSGTGLVFVRISSLVLPSPLPPLQSPTSPCPGLSVQTELPEKGDTTTQTQPEKAALKPQWFNQPNWKITGCGLLGTQRGAGVQRREGVGGGYFKTKGRETRDKRKTNDEREKINSWMIPSACIRGLYVTPGCHAEWKPSPCMQLST